MTVHKCQDAGMQPATLCGVHGQIARECIQVFTRLQWNADFEASKRCMGSDGLKTRV